MPVITVLGSLNTDMVTVTSRVPDGGETIQAKSFDVGWGGKGGNQCVAAARLSRASKVAQESDVEIRMIAAVGDDVFGPQLLKSLEDDGINAHGVRTIKGEKTGTAVILVEESTGENRILFTPGANFALKVSDELVADDEYGDVAIFQLETPLDVVGLHLWVVPLLLRLTIPGHT
jgi:ribokinase